MFETLLSDLSGDEFLWLYGGLLIVAVVVALGLPRWLKADGRDGGNPSTEELAMIAGGRNRFFEAITAQLLSVGALEVDKAKKSFRVLQPEAAGSSAERTILRQVAPIRWKDIADGARLDADAIEERVISQGWMIGGTDAVMLRFVQTLPLLLLIGFGAYRTRAGMDLGEPVGHLILFMLVVGAFALVRFAMLDRTTRGGKAVLKRALKGNRRLKRAPTAPETSKAVALFGTGVLVGTPLAAMHTMRQSTDAGAGSSSDGDGGGGCGGGCGGCGG